MFFTQYSIWKEIYNSIFHQLNEKFCECKSKFKELQRVKRCCKIKEQKTKKINQEFRQTRMMIRNFFSSRMSALYSTIRRHNVLSFNSRYLLVIHCICKDITNFPSFLSFPLARTWKNEYEDVTNLWWAKNSSFLCVPPMVGRVTNNGTINSEGQSFFRPTA